MIYSKDFVCVGGVACVILRSLTTAPIGLPAPSLPDTLSMASVCAACMPARLEGTSLIVSVPKSETETVSHSRRRLFGSRLWLCLTPKVGLSVVSSTVSP